MKFSFDLIYKNKEWKAICKWTEGESCYSHNVRLFLGSTGKNPEEAVINLKKKVDHLLNTTSNDIQQAFNKFEF